MDARALRKYREFIKNMKKITLRQVTCGNSTNLVLKKKQRHFLKIPPPKKILECKE